MRLTQDLPLGCLQGGYRRARPEQLERLRQRVLPVVEELVKDPTDVQVFFFFFTLVTGPRRSLRLKLSDTRVYEP